MTPTLPTYQNAAALLERRNGAGWRLVGWTLARSALIATGVTIAGVEPKKALAGGLVASGLITLLAVLCLAGEEPHVRSRT